MAAPPELRGHGWLLSSVQRQTFRSGRLSPSHALLRCLRRRARWGKRRFLAEDRDISFIYFVEISSRTCADFSEIFPRFLRNHSFLLLRVDLGPCATCRGAVVGIHRGGARGPGSRGGAWGRNRRWKVRELRGARRGHINRLASRHISRNFSLRQSKAYFSKDFEKSTFAPSSQDTWVRRPAPRLG